MKRRAKKRAPRSPTLAQVGLAVGLLGVLVHRLLERTNMRVPLERLSALPVKHACRPLPGDDFGHEYLCGAENADGTGDRCMSVELVFEALPNGGINCAGCLAAIAKGGSR